METIEELVKLMEEKFSQEFSYDGHVEALAEITLAAFNLAADKLGASGYSASFAELLFLQKSRRIEDLLQSLRLKI